jgi:hypothetical protein
MTNTKTTRPVSFVPFSKSRVDIIIPFHGQYKKVTALIQSIVISVKINSNCLVEDLIS